IDIIIISFIAMCIASSSATIRVEMRWVYISYVASIVYLSFIISEINFLFHNIFLNKYNIKNEKKNYYIKKAQSIVFTIFIFASFFGYKYNIDIEYRKNYPNIYFFEDQTRMNNLANMTINKYGKDNFIGKKNVYILYNIYDMSEFYASWFYRPFKYKWNGDGTRIYLINSLNEIEVDKRNDNSIILVEDLLNKSYNEFEVTKEMWEMLDDSK
ncbi:MAG: hypothetical protein Q4F88_06675, partial [Eubacteriales bacterium]|nr:hypothetical protein [Eubacteriales bacterium]